MTFAVNQPVTENSPGGFISVARCPLIALGIDPPDRGGCKFDRHVTAYRSGDCLHRIDRTGRGEPVRDQPGHHHLCRIGRAGFRSRGLHLRISCSCGTTTASGPNSPPHSTTRPGYVLLYRNDTGLFYYAITTTLNAPAGNTTPSGTGTGSVLPIVALQ